MIRGLLATLVAEIGQTIAVHRLIATLWTDPPESAEANLRGYVTRLRRALPSAIAGSLMTRRRGGYILDIDPHECDLYRFRELTKRGRHFGSIGNHAEACDSFGRAISLWRGTAGEDLPDTWAMSTFAAGLNIERHSVIEEFATQQLRLRDAHGAIATLSPLVRAEPSRERAWVLLARAHAVADGRPAGLRLLQEARFAITAAVGAYRFNQLDHEERTLAYSIHPQ